MCSMARLSGTGPRSLSAFAGGRVLPARVWSWVSSILAEMSGRELRPPAIVCACANGTRKINRRRVSLRLVIRSIGEKSSFGLVDGVVCGTMPRDGGGQSGISPPVKAHGVAEQAKLERMQLLDMSCLLWDGSEAAASLTVLEVCISLAAQVPSS